MFPPGRQGVNEVFDIGIEFADVTPNGQDVGIQCTELGLYVHDHSPRVDMCFLNEDLQEGCPNWILANVVVLVEDHRLGFGLWGDGHCKASVHHEIVLCCLGLCICINGGMVPDLLQQDLPVMAE